VARGRLPRGGDDEQPLHTQNAVKREMTWRCQTPSVLTLRVHPHSMWPLGAAPSPSVEDHDD
jgi:hypothetical protein